VLEQQLPVLLDCIGTGHIHAKGECKEQRPAPLRHAHIQAFRNRCDVGMSLLSSDELDKLLESGGVSNDLIAGTGIIGTTPLQCPRKTGAYNNLKELITRSGEADRTRTCVARELFMPQHLNEIVLKIHNSSSTSSSSSDVLEFGHVSCGSEQYRTFELTNRTSGKVCVLFPSSSNASFTVTPAVTDINGGDSAVFTVQFTPTATDSYYLQEIEACVFFKNQRTFRYYCYAMLF
jgi:Abnormal spindle-like microcephaly-assoc'd, ASPM-SPD-2-Hydin